MLFFEPKTEFHQHIIQEVPSMKMLRKFAQSEI